MFLGTYQPRLDEKGRLFLPAKFRDDLAGGMVITKGQERCLYVFTPTDFDTMTQRMASAPVTSRAGRDYMRVMYAGASSESADKQGRVMIPTALRAYAGLDRDVVVIGANSRVEIWDRPTWDAYLAEKEQTFAELSEEVLPGFM